MILKRFPFQIIVKVENSQNETIAVESLQTYVEEDEDSNIFLVGKVGKTKSKMHSLPMDMNMYISVCLKVGFSWVDNKLTEVRDPSWTMTDINERAKIPDKQGKFRIFKNGVDFVFTKGFQGNLTKD